MAEKITVKITESKSIKRVPLVKKGGAVYVRYNNNLVLCLPDGCGYILAESQIRIETEHGSYVAPASAVGEMIEEIALEERIREEMQEELARMPEPEYDHLDICECPCCRPELADQKNIMRLGGDLTGYYQVDEDHLPEPFEESYWIEEEGQEEIDPDEVEGIMSDHDQGGDYEEWTSDLLRMPVF